MYVAEFCVVVVRFPGICRRRHFLETFVEEATLMSRLHHPNLQTLVGQCLYVFAKLQAIGLNAHVLVLAVVGWGLYPQVSYCTHDSAS